MKAIQQSYHIKRFNKPTWQHKTAIQHKNNITCSKLKCLSSGKNASGYNSQSAQRNRII
uniref:Uncharacterized protein n=1 Tax=Setaria italica TaxID=4555 RepID=K3YBJ7_SETIT